MKTSEPRYDKDVVKAAAAGRWNEILVHFAGIDPASLDGEHGPCSNCGGTDRFNADREKFAETGQVWCNQNCGISGDGFHVIMNARGIEFPEAVRLVGEYLNVTPSPAAAALSRGKQPAAAAPPKGEQPAAAPAVKLTQSGRKMKPQSHEEWKEILRETKGGNDLLRKIRLNEWAKVKPGVNRDTLLRSSTRYAEWYLGKDCVVFIAATSNQKITGLQYAPVDGSMFPAFRDQKPQKTKNRAGSKDGWICPLGTKAMVAAEVIVKCEGPSDAFAIQHLLSEDCVAVTNLCGARSLPNDFAWLNGKTILVIHDADTPGQNGAREFCKAMASRAAEIRNVQLPYEVAEKSGKDLRDWVAEGGTFEELERLIDQAPNRTRKATIERMALPEVKPSTAEQKDKLDALVLACDGAPIENQSDSETEICLFSIKEGIDREDVWCRCQDVGGFTDGGEERFSAVWEQAEQQVREELFDKVTKSRSTSAKHESSDTSDPDSSESDRTRIEITTDELAVNDAVIESLAKTDGLYNFNSQLSEVREIDDKEFGKRAVATPLLNPTIREIISGNVSFYIEVGTGEEIKIVEKPTPRWCVEAVAVRGCWPGIPLLRRVVNCPVLRADGTVLQTDGYDQESGLYLDSRIEFEQVPESPSFYQVTSAVDDLMDIICDFPFVADMHRAAWLASLLTPFARETYSGPTGPMFAFDAPKAGSGKTLLVDLISMIFSGHPAWKQSAPRDDEEFRKAITSKALNTNPMELIDNISGRFGCSSLDAALTSPVWTDRILGQSRTVELPLKMAWFGTGNNIQFVADLPRRICHIRLEPSVERPDQVDGFKHSNVDIFVKENRARFVAACLTILRGFFAAGRPDQNLPHWGSYEGWTSVVRNAVVWAGLPDPGLTRQAVHDADEDTHALREMIRALLLIDPNRKGKSASEIVRIAQYGGYGVPLEHAEVLRIAIEEFTETSINNVDGRLGYRFRAVRRRIAGAHHIDRKTVNGQRLWVVNGTEFIDDDENEDLGAHEPAQGADGCTSKTAMCTPETELFP